MYIKKLKEMFAEMTVKKNVSLIPVYYHPDFILYKNEKCINYKEFLEAHESYYLTSIAYIVESDDGTFLEQSEKLQVGCGLLHAKHLNLPYIFLSLSKHPSFLYQPSISKQQKN